MLRDPFQFGVFPVFRPCWSTLGFSSAVSQACARFFGMIQGWEIMVPYFDLDRRIPNATLLLGGERGQDDNHWGLKIMLKTLSTMVSFYGVVWRSRLDGVFDHSDIDDPLVFERPSL